MRRAGSTAIIWDSIATMQVSRWGLASDSGGKVGRRGWVLTVFCRESLWKSLEGALAKLDFLTNQIWGVRKRVVKGDFRVVGLGHWKKDLHCHELRWGIYMGSRLGVGEGKIRV